MLSRLYKDSPRFTALAVFLSISTLPVLCAHALDGRVFNGVNVWNKPLKFQFSLTAYLITLAWFSRFAPHASLNRRSWVRHEQAISWAIVIELVWICGAAAAGVASHFNPGPVMAIIYGLMGLAAILLTTGSTVLAVAIHGNTGTDLDPTVKAGLVWGLGLTLPLTLITAGTMSALDGHWVGGSRTDAAGFLVTGWSLTGGDLRVAHFLATHSMQVIPFFAWLWFKSLGGGKRYPAAVIAILYAVYVLWAFVQALRGVPFGTS